MSFPTKNENHTSEALAFLTEHFKNKKNIEGVIKSFTPLIEELENVFWDIIESYLLSTPPVGDQLDNLGRLVGQSRISSDDAEYLAAVKLRIRVNRSKGLAEDVIDVARQANNGIPALYVEQFPASFVIQTDDLPSPIIIADLLSRTRSVGTYGVLHYTTWLAGNDMQLISDAGGVVGEGETGSVYDISVGGLLVSGVKA